MSTRAAAARRALASLEGPLRRLSTSLQEEAPLFPLTEMRLRANEKAIDAFLQRYQQTADLLMRKVFPLVLAVLREREDVVRFRDILDGLERQGVIDSADEWSEVNEQRNRLVHEYAMAPNERVAEINAAWVTAPMLVVAARRCAAAIAEGSTT